MQKKTKKTKKCIPNYYAQNVKTLQITPDIFRKLAISLLGDDDGVSEDSYNLMYDFLDDDIKNLVDATDGRFYIKEDAIEVLTWKN